MLRDTRISIMIVDVLDLLEATNLTSEGNNVASTIISFRKLLPTKGQLSLLIDIQLKLKRVLIVVKNSWKGLEESIIANNFYPTRCVL